MIGKILSYIGKNPTKAKLDEQVRFVPNGIGAQPQENVSIFTLT